MVKKSSKFFRTSSSIELNLYEELPAQEIQNIYNNCCTIHLTDNNDDWAEELAKKWTAVLKDIYKNKQIPKNGIVEDIVNNMGELFNQAVDNGFGIDYNTTDTTMLNVIKLNTWRFSVAKNYNDLIALNNLLIDNNGNLRSWSEFKREAQKVVGNSTRYLRTEYNTIVSSSQMARLWQEIQRDKHIFPFLQFSIVADGHTSEICKPLKDVIVSVEDPMLLTYFPPNHFNCRTTVKKLRRGVPTKNYLKPDIHPAFQNNPGQSLQIFTDENPYIKNTPFDVLQQNGLLYAKKAQEKIKEVSSEIRKQFEEYKLKYPMYQDTDDNRVKVSLWVDQNELERNLDVAKKIAEKHNAIIKLQPHTDGEFLKRPNPEYEYNGMIADRKSPKGLNLKNLFRKAQNKQNCEVIVIDLEHNPYSVEEMYQEVVRKLRNPTVNPKIKKVLIIAKDLKTTKEFVR